MKSSLLAACAVAALCFVASASQSYAQSNQDLLLRLEAKIDALSKENALLRDRVKRIETARSTSQPPVRVAALGNSASDAMPAASNTEAARAARAANMPAKAMEPARIACAGQWWQGGYVGINGGASYHSAYRQDQAISATVGGADEGNILNTFGGAVGAQAGYNWASCNTFWGVEIDGDWTSNSHFRDTIPGAIGASGGIEAKLQGVVTARTRAGVILDKMMLYVTGGVAALDTKTVHSASFDSFGTLSATVNDWRFGWVAGVGAEWAWTDRLSLRSEVLYIGTADKQAEVITTTTGIFPSSTAFLNQHDSVVLSRVGVNYKLSN